LWHDAITLIAAKPQSVFYPLIVSELSSDVI